jgi:hypothetical protein
VPTTVGGLSYTLHDPGSALRAAARSGADALGTFNRQVQSDPYAAGQTSAAIFVAVEGTGLAAVGGAEAVGAEAGVAEGADASASLGRSIRFADLGTGNLGETNPYTGDITIQRGLSGQALDETIRHETVHLSMAT